MFKFLFPLYSFAFFFFRATPAAYGSSQARGRIRATAAGLHIATATGDPSHNLDLHHSSPQHWILNPLSKARDRTHILLDTSWIHFHCATMGTPPLYFCYVFFHCFLFFLFLPLLTSSPPTPSFLFLFFFFQPHLQHTEVPGPGTDPNLICNLHHSCGNTRSLTH